MVGLELIQIPLNAQLQGLVKNDKRPIVWNPDFVNAFI